MKIGLIGDIHGNADALNAVLLSAVANNVEKLLITGDLVGYYFQPKQVLEILAPWEKFIVRGNHEDMLCRSRGDPDYLTAVEARYGSGVRVALDQLSSQQLDEICGLPHPLCLEIDGVHIMLSHGSPWNVDQYIYPDAASDLIERCVPEGFDLVVTGHTHYPMVKTAGNAVLVNPGSVGQPRNRKLGAHWAVFDTHDRSVDLHRTPYDCSQLVLECRKRHPELPYLADVLERVL